jgi:hypothetical protein
MLGNTIPTCLSKAILKAVADHLASAPEEPARPLLVAQHPPPARKLIEERLQEATQKVAERKRALQHAENDSSMFAEEELEINSESTLPPSPPPAKRPRLATCSTASLPLTVKSGSEFTFTLPENVKEQCIFLKVVQ